MLVRLSPIFVPAGVAMLIALAGCGHEAPPTNDADWPHYNGSYTSTRFSNLTEITPANVGLGCRMTRVCHIGVSFNASLTTD